MFVSDVNFTKQTHAEQRDIVEISYNTSCGYTGYIRYSDELFLPVRELVLAKLRQTTGYESFSQIICVVNGEQVDIPGC